ncbi:MAG: hypothetical protein K2W95_17625 [Candidatus Obscuribacterales bacterium]|nr:hypothetical protein [Candidatus Obscuribacterales bacterium]
MKNIRALSFDESMVDGWFKADDTERGIGWIDNKDRPGNIVMKDFNAFPFPYVFEHASLFKLRQYWRNDINKDGGGLVECNLITVAGILSCKVIGKWPMNPTGMAYFGWIIVPLEDCHFKLHARAFELGMTGIRDAMILAKMQQDGTIKFSPSDPFAGWAKDPYEPLSKFPLMPNLSEDAKYDFEFPDHPLSRCRKFLTRFERSSLLV